MEKNLLQKLKPFNFSHLILVERIKKALNYGGDMKRPPLLYGAAGHGKTSTAIVLAKQKSGIYLNTYDISDEPCIMKFNASDGVEVLTKAAMFLKTTSLFSDKPKTVFFEEFDSASHQFYLTFKTFFDDYSELGFIIATCNDFDKVVKASEGAVKSRFNYINYDCINDDEVDELRQLQLKQCQKILSQKSINIKASDDAVLQLIDSNSLDWRPILYKIEEWVENGITELTDAIIEESVYAYVDIFKMLINKKLDHLDIYKNINVKYADKVDNILKTLSTKFIDWLILNGDSSQQMKVGRILIIVSQYQYRQRHVVDQLTNLRACLYHIQTVMQSK